VRFLRKRNENESIANFSPIASLLKQNNSLEEKLVAIYKWVRDLPYEVRLDPVANCYENLAYIKTNKRGSCSPKHYLLGAIYEELEVSVEYLTYPFYWYELPVIFPYYLKKLAEKVPLTYHLAIRICFKDEKIFLDATWDPPLEKAGFPINKIGDKLVNTRNAIVPCGECIIHKNVLERDAYIKTRKTNTEANFQFYIALNAWLEDLRKI